MSLLLALTSVTGTISGAIGTTAQPSAAAFTGTVIGSGVSITGYIAVNSAPSQAVFISAGVWVEPTLPGVSVWVEPTLPGVSVWVEPTLPGVSTWVTPTLPGVSTWVTPTLTTGVWTPIITGT